MTLNEPSLLLSAAMVAGVVRGLQRFLNLPVRWPQADRALRWLAAAALIGYVLKSALHIKGDMPSMVYWVLVSGVLLYVLTKLSDYRPARTLRLAGAPLMATFVIDFVTSVALPSLNKTLEDPIGVAQVFSLIWMLVFVNIAKREKRTLAAEEEARAEAERLRLIEEARKAELERLVSERTTALRRQTTELEEALTNLRATQTQLIQSEKMASLGELTAGIAHEIQNPLNFVTNFADVSTELVAELKAAQATGDTEEVNALADDLAQNLQKITDHGRRAASIVRGMLEHSRASSGERTPTDLNALADEYMRLAYHGLRAKDKSFNATLSPNLEPGLPPVTVVAPDLGRVLLNLFTNAFYAVRQRQLKGEPGYQPTVAVATRSLPGGGTELRIRDNGTGIPEAVRAKIFQPFFTTKPTGEGTGLGLSLSFDIITKTHGGKLAVDSREGEYTEFTVTLPA